MYDDFEKNFNKTRNFIKKSTIYGFIISAILSIGGIVFFIWIIIKLMGHFGIL